MKTQKIPQTDLLVSRIGYGCGMLVDWDIKPVRAEEVARAARLVNTAFDQGITLFDHADVYASGKCEAAFGAVLQQSPSLRQQMVIQTKCGQRFPDDPHRGDAARVDSSREHLVRSVEGSLKRLRTDYLDILLLHAPDALVDPQEVAQAIDDLHGSGKVRHFGVSNHNAAQIALLKKHVGQPLVINQIYLGLLNSQLFADGQERTLDFTKNARELMAFVRGGPPPKERQENAYLGVAGTGILDYCRLHDMQIQAYSPLRGELLNPTPHASPEVKEAARGLRDLAKKKRVAPSAVALAWLLRHPAGIVPITGPTHLEHLVENCSADGVELSREEWYALFTAAAAIGSRKLN